MRGHDPDFIQERLEWRLRKNGGLFTSTGLWEDAPSNLRDQLPSEFVRPVIYSLSLNDGATIIGVDQLCILSATTIELIDLDKLKDISSVGVNEQMEKKEFDSILVADGCVEWYLPTEAGAACFAMWNTILTLIRMKKVG